MLWASKAADANSLRPDCDGVLSCVLADAAVDEELEMTVIIRCVVVGEELGGVSIVSSASGEATGDVSTSSSEEADCSRCGPFFPECQVLCSLCLGSAYIIEQREKPTLCGAFCVSPSDELNDSCRSFPSRNQRER